MTVSILISSLLALAAVASFAAAAIFYNIAIGSSLFFWFILFGILNLLILIFFLYFSCIRSDGIQGLILRIQIIRNLQESGIYTLRKDGSTKLPKVAVHLNEERTKGTVSIETTLKTQSRLENELSSAFGEFVVTQKYISKDRNRIICEIRNYNYSPQLCFNSFNQMQSYCSRYAATHRIVVDKDLYFTYQHVLLTGQTGSGKSYALYNFIAQMLITKSTIYFIDLKNAGIAILGSAIDKEHTAVNLNETIQMLRQIKDKQDIREAEVKDRLILQNNFDGDWTCVGLDPCFIIIDEYAAFQAASKELDKKSQIELESIITSILLKGRSTGMFLFICMQQAHSSTFPTKFRDNISAKFLMRRGMEHETAVTTFGESAIKELPFMNCEAGNAFYKISGLNSSVSECVFPKLNFTLKEICNEPWRGSKSQRQGSRGQ